MSAQRSAKLNESPRRPWLRGLCLTATVVLVGAVAVSVTAQDDSGSGSRLFRFPNLFGSSSKEEAPVETPTDTRILRRVRQLMADAQQLETSGYPAAALDMARRAASVLSTAGRTAGVQWPAGQRTPADYVQMLEQKVRAASPVPAPSRPTRQADLSATPDAPVRVSTPKSSATTHAPLPKPTSQSNGLLLNWGDRARPAIPEGNRPAAATVETSENDIQLSGSEQPAGGALTDSTSGPPVDDLLDRLRTLDTWGSPGATSATSGIVSTPPTQSTLQSTSPGSPAIQSQLPANGGWQPEINDQNVGPIPTQAPPAQFENIKPAPGEASDPETPGRLTVDWPASPTPAFPLDEPSDDTDPFEDSNNSPAVADTAPIETEAAPIGPQSIEVAGTESPGNESVTDDPAPAPQVLVAGPGPAEAGDSKADSNLLLVAAIQVLATFVGVLLAILVFRAVAIRIWGPGMGLIVPVTQSETTPAASQEHNAEGADVVPFSGAEQASAGQTELPDPASVPFRLVGASSYEDERQAEEQAEREREEAILKCVFEQNLDLVDELQGIKKSA